MHMLPVGIVYYRFGVSTNRFRAIDPGPNGGSVLSMRLVVRFVFLILVLASISFILIQLDLRNVISKSERFLADYWLYVLGVAVVLITVKIVSSQPRTL